MYGPIPYDISYVEIVAPSSLVKRMQFLWGDGLCAGTDQLLKRLVTWLARIVVCWLTNGCSSQAGRSDDQAPKNSSADADAIAPVRACS